MSTGFNEKFSSKERNGLDLVERKKKYNSSSSSSIRDNQKKGAYTLDPELRSL